jgi:hypothetical protein
MNTLQIKRQYSRKLTQRGFILLAKDLETAKKESEDPAVQLEAMWIAYWNFALNNREMYQLMYGVQMTCCKQSTPEADAPYDLITSAIADLMGVEEDGDCEVIMQKYFTFFSVIHGLISINIVGNGLPDDINKQILKDAISGIIRYIKE